MAKKFKLPNGTKLNVDDAESYFLKHARDRIDLLHGKGSAEKYPEMVFDYLITECWDHFRIGCTDRDEIQIAMAVHFAARAAATAVRAKIERRNAIKAKRRANAEARV